MTVEPQKTFAITGMPRPAGVTTLTQTIPYTPGMPLRSEISAVYDSLVKSSPAAPDQNLLRMQWTLFILGLERFKGKTVSDRLSYFQIAGIHGYPETSWDGVTKPNPDPEQGYCHHNDIAFPTWHRPYILLYEQCIWLNMKEVIESWGADFAQKDAWYDAASTWRLYYWDWGYQARLPGVTGPAVITVWLPDNTGAPNNRKDDYKNPLCGFVNPETDANNNPLPFGKMPEEKKQWNIKAHQNYPWNECSGVSRYGLKSAKPGPEECRGINNYDIACQEMDNMAALWYTPRGPQTTKPSLTLGDALNRMFSPAWNKTWGSFASTKWNSEYELDTELGYMSLEFIHNNIHNICGGTTFESEKGKGVGHMSDVPVAAFDPIFWLHHCNIDRLLAMWQILHWQKWWDSAEPEERVNQVDVGQSDPLIPFHTTEVDDPNSSFWTSDMARDWTKLNYQYADLLPTADAIGPDGKLIETKYIEDLQDYINVRYPGTSHAAFNVFVDPDIDNAKFFGKRAVVEKWEDATWRDYIVNIRYDRYALRGASYSIQFFLGGKGDDNREAALADQENYVGEVYSFGGMALRTGEEGGCPNCAAQKDAKILSKGQVPLTIPLIKQAVATDERFVDIHSIKVDEVEDYLAKHLHWKFVQFGGQEAAASVFPETKISVWVGTGKPTLRDGKWLPPTYTDYKPLWEATEGKEGGLMKSDPNLGDAHWTSGNA